MSRTAPTPTVLPRLVGVGRVTLQTVADKVGVSRMTVSNAFSKPDQLSETLRSTILAAAAELGYSGPDPAARALARGSAGSVGVLMTDSLSYAFTDEVATGFLGAVTAELAPTGLALSLVPSSVTGPRIPARDVPMDGALVYSCLGDSEALDWLVRRNLPLVYVDQDAPADAPSVNVDDRGGARAAAQHLVDLGHRRIGIVNGERHGAPDADDPQSAAGVERHVSRERLLGWTDALSAAGIEPLVSRQPQSPDSGGQVVQALLDLAEPPTAILCFSDVIAFGVVRAAEDRGLVVPTDLSVVGFDDNPLARRMRPALTTVRQDVAAKGRAAAAALTAAIERVQAGGVPEARHVLLKTELVVRDSTAPVPA
jgi:DNA-binding LacI/PurR family transcriptional regulator